MSLRQSLWGVASLSIVLILSACSSGMGTRVRGEYCSAAVSANPIPLDVKETRQLSLENTNDPDTMPKPGTYLYNGSEIYFRQVHADGKKNGDRFTIADIQHKKDPKGDWKFLNGCLRLAKIHEPFGASFYAVTRFTVNENGEISIEEVKEVSFEYNGKDKINHALNDVDDADLDSLKKAYVLENGTALFFERKKPGKNESKYEIRSKIDTKVGNDDLSRQFAVRYEHFEPGAEVPALNLK